MKLEKVLKIINIICPLAGMGIMIFYRICDTSCSSLKGIFLGVDLKIIGLLFMAALLVMTLSSAARWVSQINILRTVMLSGAVGGEIILIHFQLVHSVYCPFCLAFGTCILILFAANFMKMNRYLAAGAFLAGIAAFALFFNGSVLPLYE